MTFVIARTASKRPSLQHILQPEDDANTVCGLYIAAWSRAYQKTAISAVLCVKCGKIQAGVRK